jgi:hypothetical protein
VNDDTIAWWKWDEDDEDIHQDYNTPTTPVVRVKCMPHLELKKRTHYAVETQLQT